MYKVSLMLCLAAMGTYGYVMERQDCPVSNPNFVSISDTCYFVEKTPLTYDDAQLNCQNKLGTSWTLFEPRDINTNRLVFAAAGNLVPNAYWLGINDRVNQGQYVYASDNYGVVDGLWRAGEPNGDNERCVIGYYKFEYLGEWLDYPCDKIVSSICQRKQETVHGCLELQTAMPHNDVKLVENIPSWQECDQQCMDEDECSFWTYREDKMKCFLKSSDVNREVDSNAVSGTKGCSAACPPGMQLNTDENINNNEQRCISCPDGFISDGTVPNGGCTDCSNMIEFEGLYSAEIPPILANVEQTACIIACPNDMPSNGGQCRACPEGLGVIAPSSKCNTCPEETPLTAVDGETCLSTCPAEHALIKPWVKKCVVACPAGYYMHGTPLACLPEGENTTKGLPTEGTTNSLPTEGTTKSLPTEGTTKPPPTEGTTKPPPTEGTTKSLPTEGTTKPPPTEGTTKPPPTEGTTKSLPTEGTTKSL